ncbi:hypothetical protein HRbin17_01494 [bacterium HR17]|uniref:Uncharacterized protein n=1 Tax=Candidatus Fervidibacter japonicus TaxID=2035412 RepID=A0A2H5XCR9_9BACT|nr:hypothetical protein HRbin17_01494 [bacterium HR17]
MSTQLAARQLPAETRAPLSHRVVVIAAGLTVAFALLVPYNDLYLRNTPLAGNLLPTNTVLTLLVLAVGINPLLRRWAPRWALSSAELAGLWALLLIPSGIPMAGFWRYILPQVASLAYHASPANRWDVLLLPYAPDWLVLTDRVAARGFYEGAGGVIPWAAWSRPLMFWTPLGAALVLATACTAALVRRQWTDYEHFVFPLVQLPAELVQSPVKGWCPPLMTQPAFWCGFGASALFHTLCGLNAYYPAIPAPQRVRRLGDYLTGFPWDAIAGTFVNIYPAAIGLTYLLTSDIAFSLWFFYLLERLQQVVFAYYGWTGLGYSATDFVQYQQVGAVLGLLSVIVYAGRTHWRQVVAAAVKWRRRSDGAAHEDTDEPLPYTAAVWGGIASAGFICVWLMARGVSGLLAVTFVAMTLGFYVAAAWIASNSGLLMVQMRILPHDPVWALLGSRRFSPRDVIVSFLLQEAFAYDLRETLMPSLLNAMKMADMAKLSRRQVMAWGMGLIALSVPVALWMWLRLCYTYGGVNLEPSTFQWHAFHPYLLTVQAIDPGLQPNAVRATGMAAGFAVFVGSFALRWRIAHFPLHPIGLVVCRGWAMENFWLMVLVGWTLKGLTVRYGGLQAYRRGRPLFLGLILGDLTMGGVFGALGAITRRGYVVLP